MTLLEIISKAAANPEEVPFKLSRYPITLNADAIFPKLNPQSEEDVNDPSLVKRVTGWEISQNDSELIESAHSFYKKLKRSLKDTRNFKQDEFLNLLTSFLVTNGIRIGVKLGINQSDRNYNFIVVEKLGFLMGRDVAKLVTEACVNLEVWEMLGILIVNGYVLHSCCSSLVSKLVDKRRSDLLSLCVKHFKDLQSSDIACILKYFLSLREDEYSSLVSVKREWQGQGELAVERITDGTYVGQYLQLAKEAAVLLKLANGVFRPPELCLHYMLSSLKVDEVILGSAISKLNGTEIMRLIRYLGKWLRKYERFPQACPCPDAPAKLGLTVCAWVPTCEDVVNCLGLVVDEHFSSLILNPEFHEELTSIEGGVSSLALEAKLCQSVANVVENLKAEAEA